MSVTYPADPAKPYGDRLELPRVDPHAELTNDEPFVPVYARRGKSRTGQSKIKSWMILAPVGAIVLGGIGAMMFMGGSEEVATPLAEPAATAPVVSALPAPVDAAAVPLTSESAPAPVAAAAPVVREAAPVRRAAPAPAPTPRRQAAPAPASTAPRVVAPAPAVGPQPYAPAPAASPTPSLNTATPAPTPTPAPPPAIVVQPLG